jgi:CO/xanthine dehydrogenase Mo-binding subunit
MAQSELAGPIGRPLNRVDGPLKVTGKAKYAFEYAAQDRAAYGFIDEDDLARAAAVDGGHSAGAAHSAGSNNSDFHGLCVPKTPSV